VSKHKKYVPKHRHRPTPGTPVKAVRNKAVRNKAVRNKAVRNKAVRNKAVRNTVVLSGLAVAATGATVGGGVLSGSSDQVQTVGAEADLDGVHELSAGSVERNTVASRSESRLGTDPAKAATLAATDSTANAVTRTEDIGEEDPRAIGRALLSEFGFGSDQFGCLDSLWTRESNWRVDADNPSSSAYGIPQALPGSKMSSTGSDWAYNPVTQIRWGLGYIADRYGSPCAAWGHSESVGWY
jgi:hypothetical protein